MTHKQFKEILTNAGFTVDYAAILVSLECHTWRNANDYKSRGLENAARSETRLAHALHEELEAAGIYDGFDELVNQAV